MRQFRNSRTRAAPARAYDAACAHCLSVLNLHHSSLSSHLRFLNDATLLAIDSSKTAHLFLPSALVTVSSSLLYSLDQFLW